MTDSAGDESPTLTHSGPVDRSGIAEDWMITTPFVRIDPETGEIIETGYMPRAALPVLSRQFDATYVPVEADPAMHYIDLATSQPKAREPNPARLDGMTLRDLPAPCAILISNPQASPTRYVVGTDTVTLGFEHPGTYEVRVKRVEYLDAVFSVTVPA